MRILFIAPIPPPIDGQSKASKVLLEALLKNNEVEVVDLSKNSLKNGIFSLGRGFKILTKLFEVWRKNNKKDIIYLSLAESFAGNMRDLAVYIINYRKIDKVFIHMLGGAGMKEILNGNGLIKKLNAYFMKRIGGVIVEGPINYQMFCNVMPKEKVYVVPNFAENYLFVTEQEINQKFNDISIINILYLSNLIPGKGYDELADAFITLNDADRAKLAITFVGGFESVNDEINFLDKIKPYNQMKYLGKFIDGEEKRKLYCQSHVFCLPTYYPFEGQPISILEAYATGCIVITSDHSGIPFVFKDQVNGIGVEKRSVNSLKSALQILSDQKIDLVKIANNNREEALEKYRTEIFQDAIVNIFESTKK